MDALLPVVKRKETIELEYQNYIEKTPVAPEQLYRQACSGDGPTISNWSKVWLANIKANKEKFGDFAEMGIGQLHQKFSHKFCLLAGSGPSLKFNGHLLKEKRGIPLLSCLHNYHYMIDNDIKVDYFVSLDAGELPVEEVYEGGSKTPEEYWESTKDQMLICYIGSSPRLLEKWRGKVYFFNACVPDAKFNEDMNAIANFHNYVSSGGNVLGACLYIAKAYLGCPGVAFVGADFSFSYDKKFHGWDSKYDKKLGNVIRIVDVFGNKALTWQSYFGFKGWFDWVAETIPGIYINCTEGGAFGAYPEGNIMNVRQMPLSQFLNMCNVSEIMRKSCESPREKNNLILF